MAEAAHTHHGEKKTLHFNESKANFSEFSSKLMHVIITNLPEGGIKTWEMENFQRREIGRIGINQVNFSAFQFDFSAENQENVIIIVNDADEIPSADTAYFLKNFQGYPPEIQMEFRWTLYGFYFRQLQPTRLYAATTLR